MRRRPDWFLPGMVLMVALAWLWPEPGAQGGWLHADTLTKAGVAVIFFLHGLLLSLTALQEGARRWPVHLVVQLGTYGLFPLLGWLALYAIGPGLPPGLRLGLFFMCALPSTVASAVILTAAAGGNVTVALFNATLSNLAGVLLTPLWVGARAQAAGHALALGPVWLGLVYWLILPLAAGLALRPWLGSWVTVRKAAVNRLDKAIILLMVYGAFCDSVQRQVWAHTTWHALAILLLTLAALFVVMAAGLWAVGRLWRFSRGDAITAIFCGSKKTLIMGVPMAGLIFGARPDLGLILLPIMIYHALQLVACGALADHWVKQGQEAALV